jgi:hypothetical protein
MRASVATMNKLVFIAMIATVVAVNCSAPSSGTTPTTAILDSRFSVGTAPGSLELADLNGDGRLDIVVANERSDDATVLLGDGKGGFTNAKGSPFAAGRGLNDIAVGDYDGDGRPDLAFANHEQKALTVFLGDGQGGFSPAPGSPVAVTSNPHTHGVASGDFNGDGKLDLVTDNWGKNEVTVVLGDGHGGFSSPGVQFAVGKMPYQRVRAKDVTGDGRADIVTTNLEGNDVTILVGDGRGGFRQSPGSPFPCGDSPFSVAIGDVNRDGKLDLAIVNSPSSAGGRSGRDGLTILLGDGTGGFKQMAGSPFAAGKVPNRVAIGAVDGNGVADVAVTNTEGDDVTLFLMSDKGSVASSSTIAVGKKPKGIAIGELNGDGKADIVVANNGDDNVSVLLRR